MAQLVAFAAIYQALLVGFISWDSEGDGELLGWVWRPQQVENSTGRGVASWRCGPFSHFVSHFVSHFLSLSLTCRRYGFSVLSGLHFAPPPQ